VQENRRYKQDLKSDRANWDLENNLIVLKNVVGTRSCIQTN